MSIHGRFLSRESHNLNRIFRQLMYQDQSALHQHFEEALKFHRTGQVDKASFFYAKVLATDANHAVSQHHLSVLKFEQGDYAAALTLQNQLIEQHPNKAGYFNNRGNTLVRLGHFEDALKDFDQAIRLESYSAEFLVNRANAFAALDQSEPALADLTQAIALSPLLAMAYANRANVFHNASRHLQALADIDQALALEPGNSQFHYNKGNILVKLQRNKEATEQYQLACAFDEDFELAHLKWANLLMSMQALPEAAQVLQTAHARHPQSEACLVLLGEVHALLDEINIAKGYFDQAKTLNPLDEEVDYYAAANLGLPPPLKAPMVYVKKLFDGYAPHFETQLQQELAYASPAHLHTQWLRHAQAPIESALDLGCGTGLVAKSFKPDCRFIDGVDISAQMIKKSQATGLYRQLHMEEVHVFLKRNLQAYDLVVCADTLVYIGELDALFAGVRQALTSGGFFSFTVETTSSPSYALKQSKRYGHAIAYLELLAKQTGLQVVVIEGDMIRHEQPVPVQGFNLLLKKI